MSCRCYCKSSIRKDGLILCINEEIEHDFERYKSGIDYPCDIGKCLRCGVIASIKKCASIV